jgi:hypothetical protein
MHLKVYLFLGLGLLGLGTLVTWINVYTSFIRYPLHRWRGGTRENFQWVSGAPFVGSMMLWSAAFLLVGHPVLIWTALIISLFDTGGPHWLVGTMTYMTFFRRRRGSNLKHRDDRAAAHCTNDHHDDDTA